MKSKKRKKNETASISEMLREEENFPANNIRLSQMVPHRIATRQNETLFQIFFNFPPFLFFVHIVNAAMLFWILLVVMNFFGLLCVRRARTISLSRLNIIFF